MAGTDQDFNAAEFRDAIHLAMRMGLPEETDQRITFRWSSERTYARADPAGHTYDFTQAPTATVTVADLQVDCAWEFVARPAGSDETVLGQFDESRIVVTLLDEEYDEVLDHGDGTLPDQIVAGLNVYNVDFETPPVGLFDVTVHQLYATARDES